MPGLGIGIVSNGRKVQFPWAISLPMLAMNLPVGMAQTWMASVGSDRAENRQRIAEQAVSFGLEYLFFVDDDTVCPSFTLRYLHYSLANDQDAFVCGGIYPSKTDPPTPLVFQEIGSGPFWQWKVGQVFECKGIATGAMLIKTSIFSKLEKPWFSEPDESLKDATVSLNGHDVPLVNNRQTDDIYFCQKVSVAGGKILAHGGVLASHFDEDGREYTLPLDSYPFKKD